MVEIYNEIFTGLHSMAHGPANSQEEDFDSRQAVPVEHTHLKVDTSVREPKAFGLDSSGFPIDSADYEREFDFPLEVNYVPNSEYTLKATDPEDGEHSLNAVKDESGMLQPGMTKYGAEYRHDINDCEEKEPFSGATINELDDDALSNIIDYEPDGLIFSEPYMNRTVIDQKQDPVYFREPIKCLRSANKGNNSETTISALPDSCLDQKDR